MTQTRLLELIDRYLTEVITDSEREELVAAIEEKEWAEHTKAVIHDFLDKRAFNYGPNLDSLYAKIATAVADEHQPTSVIHRAHFLRRIGFWRAAAIFILALSGTVYLLTHKDQSGSAIVKVQEEIKAPESNKATITLPNGQTIMLDTVPNGTLIAGIARKTADGRLVFEGNATDIAYIVTSNPRNSKAMYISLPDGTEVWLNADTYLQYPTNYNQKDRLVSLKGEAYFEVKHNEAKPFRVSAGEQTIEDVGTSFNVKAYADEPHVQTTLLEGIVRINNSVSLRPGQQFSNYKVIEANTDEVMAWKNGSFYLDGREFGMVANELGRWYDVEVVFENESAKRNIVFGGEMGRSLTLQKVIEVLRELKVKCRLEGKKLIVE